MVCADALWRLQNGRRHVASSHFGRPLAVWIYSGLLALIGIVLIAGGTRLLSFGGSSYYLIAGLLTTASGWLTWRGKRLGAWLYGVLLVLTADWASEVPLPDQIMAGRLDVEQMAEALKDLCPCNGKYSCDDACTAKAARR